MLKVARTQREPKSKSKGAMSQKMINKRVGSKHIIKGMYARLRQKCWQIYTMDLFTNLGLKLLEMDYHDFNGFYKNSHTMNETRNLRSF